MPASGLSPLAWVGSGGVMLAIGLWRNWSPCIALGVGGAITGLALFGLKGSGPLEQGMMFAGLSLIAWIGGRRMNRLADSLAEAHRSGLGPIGHAAIVVEDFQNGHGTVAVDGEIYAAVCRDNPKKGARVRVTGRTDEAFKVEIAG